MQTAAVTDVQLKAFSARAQGGRFDEVSEACAQALNTHLRWAIVAVCTLSLPCLALLRCKELVTKL